MILLKQTILKLRTLQKNVNTNFQLKTFEHNFYVNWLFMVK